MLVSRVGDDVSQIIHVALTLLKTPECELVQCKKSCMSRAGTHETYI